MFDSPSSCRAAIISRRQELQQQQEQQQQQKESALFDQRNGGERPSVASSVSSSVCSDGEPWSDDGQWVDGSIVLESADQLARQVNQAWEYATELASRPVTAACDVRSPSAAANLPRQRRCSRESMLAAESGGNAQLPTAAAAALVISPRRLRSAGTASVPAARAPPAASAPQQRPASTAGRPTTASVVTHRIPLIHLQSLGHPNPSSAPPPVECHPPTASTRGLGGVNVLKPRGTITSAAMCKAALAERRSGRLSRPQTADPASGYQPAWPGGGGAGGGGGGAGGGGGGAGGGGRAGGGRAERPSSALASYACVWGKPNPNPNPSPSSSPSPKP